MSDFFKKFKNVFVVDESGNKKNKLDKHKDVLPSKSNDEDNIIENEKLFNKLDAKKSSVSLDDVKVDSKFTRILLKSLEKNDQEGYDYLEFKSTLKSLSSMSMDEKTKFQSAQAMAKAMSVSVENIVKSADFYLQILAQEEKLFEDALKNQHKDKVLRKKEGIVQLKKKIEAAKKKINELQSKIQLTQSEIDKYQTELNDSLDKMNLTKASFIKTYVNMTSQIKDDRNKIIKYLK